MFSLLMPEWHLLFSIVKKVNKKTTRHDSFPNHQTHRHLFLRVPSRRNGLRLNFKFAWRLVERLPVPSHGASADG
jgi:hypothetical protein